MSDSEKIYYYVDKLTYNEQFYSLKNKRIYKDEGMYTFDGVESALSKNGYAFSYYDAICQLIEDEAGKQYLAPRKRYDTAIIDDSGKRVIYDKEKLAVLFAECFAQQLVRYEDVGRFLKQSKEDEPEYKKHVLKHYKRMGKRWVKVIFPTNQAPVLNETIDKDV